MVWLPERREVGLLKQLRFADETGRQCALSRLAASLKEREVDARQRAKRPGRLNRHAPSTLLAIAFGIDAVWPGALQLNWRTLVLS